MFPARSFLQRCGRQALRLLIVALAVAGCEDPVPGYFQGYVEGEYLHVASPLGGTLETLAVRRGQQVAAGDPLFALDKDFEAAAVAEGGQRLRQAENRLTDLTKGQRPSEIAAVQARLERARAERDLARVEHERRQQLFAEKTISAEELDQARTARQRRQAEVDELNAQLQTARLGARIDEIEAARAEVKAARESLEQARWRLAQKSKAAAEGAYVQDTLYVEGEFVSAGLPVVSLLPPRHIKIRFFVPEAVVGTLSPGQQVAVLFDGARRTYRAEISFISPQAEYTPPVIYSRETRAKLVFMIEARPAAGDAPDFHPGQPVEVRLEVGHD